MTLPENIRPFVLPAAWLASAALAFCLGRLTALSDAYPGNDVRGVSSPSDELNRDFPAHSARGTGGESEPGTGDTQSTVEGLTGGKPLAEWLKHLLGADDDIARMKGFMLFLERVNSSAEFTQALDAVLQAGGRGYREHTMLFQKWATIDPKAAMAYVQRLQDKGAKFGGMNTVLQTWVRLHPQEAVAWAKANGASREQHEGEGDWAMASVITQLAKTDLNQAIQLAQGQGASRTSGRIIDGLVGQLLSQRDDNVTRDAILSVTDESIRKGMIQQYSARIAGHDPKKALAWIASLPPLKGRSSALADAVAQWAQKDAVAAAAYMTTLSAGPENDEPRARFARSVVRADPAGAVAWSASISDPDVRTRTTVEIVGTWMRQDSDAASRWVATSTLPEETKKQILAGAVGRRGTDGADGPGIQ